MHLDFDIIVPVYEDREGLERTLRSLNSIDGTLLSRTFVSVDGTSACEEVARIFGTRVRSGTTNRGSYAARNAAIADTRSPLILLLDAGVEPQAAWLDAMLSASTEADYVAGNIAFPALPKEATYAQAYQCIYGFPVKRYLEKDQYGPTANIAVSRRVIEKIGGFDANLRSGGDAEFGKRVHSAGFKQSFSAAGTVTHEYRTLAQLQQKQRRVIEGRLALFESHATVFRAKNRTLLRRLTPPLNLPKRHDAAQHPYVVHLKAWLVLYRLRIYNALLMRQYSPSKKDHA